MKAMTRALGLLVVAITLSFQPAAANSFTTDQSDLWYIATESGWGIQLVQRGSIIFATMFVYGSNGTPTWYVATMGHVGSYVWTGDLYTTSGPWFGAVPFDPATVANRKVGTMTWASPIDIRKGTLNYVVDGVPVTKNVTRQTLVFDNFGGTYVGAMHFTSVNCLPPNPNGTIEVFGTLLVSQSGQNMTVTFLPQSGGSVSAVGTLTQDGQFGTLNGTYTSSAGEAGTAAIFEMTVQFNHLALRLSFTSTNTTCQDTGYIAAIRSQP
jgi:hypothetical protein